MTKNLRGNCQHCGSSMAFPAEQAGESAPCPHCGRPTELLLAPPPPERNPLAARAVLFVSVALLILLGGVIGAQLALKRARRMTGQTREPGVTGQLADPIARAGFRVSAVTLEHSTNRNLTYAVGQVTDLANRKRFGVRLELALFNRAGQPCGTAKDYAATLESGGTWHFRAMVLTAQATRAEVTSVTEEP